MAQIKATIDRFEEDKLVLILEDGQQIILDKIDLSFAAQEGDVVYLNLSLSQADTQAKENLAKNILNEILKQKNET